MVAELTDFLFLSFLSRFKRSTVEEARSYRRTLSRYVSSFKCIIICKGNGLRDRKKQCDDFVRSTIVENVVARILTRVTLLERKVAKNVRLGQNERTEFLNEARASHVTPEKEFAI